jgi:hypothetical protein
MDKTWVCSKICAAASYCCLLPLLLIVGVPGVPALLAALPAVVLPALVGSSSPLSTQ